MIGDGSIVVNASGTINVQAEQNASFGTATTTMLGLTAAASDPGRQHYRSAP